jgi:hypothetical protein
MKKVKISDLIYIKDDVLSVDFCNHLIDKYEQDERKKPGVVSRGGLDVSYKNCTDLFISNLDNWKEDDQILFNCSSQLLKEYNEYCSNLFPSLFFYSGNWNYSDNGYQIQRYVPGEYYNWHHDFDIDFNKGSRMVTILWYLNTLKNEGFTEFLDGTKIEPRCGRVILYPSSWDFVHRGISPSKSKKYIVVSVLYGYPLG